MKVKPCPVWRSEALRRGIEAEFTTVCGQNQDTPCRMPTLSWEGRISAGSERDDRCTHSNSKLWPDLINFGLLHGGQFELEAGHGIPSDARSHQFAL